MDHKCILEQTQRRKVRRVYFLLGSDLVTVCEHLQCEGLRFLGEATQSFQTWVLGCGCVSLCQGTSCVSMCMCVCVSRMGTQWDLPGQFLENHMPSSDRHWQQLGWHSFLTARCGQPLCLYPSSARMVWMPALAEGPWEATSHGPAQLAHIGQEPGLESRTLVVL